MRAHVVNISFAVFFVSEWTSVEEKWTTASAMDREIRQIDVSSADYYKTVENFKTKLDFLQKNGVPNNVVFSRRGFNAFGATVSRLCCGRAQDYFQALVVAVFTSEVRYMTT